MPTATSPNESIYILASAAIVYVVIQFGLKRIFPKLTARYSIMINLVLTVVGTIFAARPESFSAAASIVAQAFLAAGGIHGIIKAASTPPPPAPEPKPGVGPGLIAAILLVGLLCLGGCVRGATAHAPAALPTGAVNALDASANQTLQTAHAFAVHITGDVTQRKIVLTEQQLSLVAKFNRLLNVADAVEIAYHACGVSRQGLAGGMPCATEALIQNVSEVQGAFATLETSLTPAPAH